MQITNKQSRTKLPGIVAAKSEALPVICWCPRRGKLWIQTTPWLSPADWGRMNHHGVWFRVAIEADEIFFKDNGTPKWWFWAEAVVVWPTFHSMPLSRTLSDTTLIFSSVLSTPVLDSGAMGGWVMTDAFHHYHCPGPNQSWGRLFSLTWYGSSARWTSFLLSILIFVSVLSTFISSIIFPIGCVCYWLFVAQSSQIRVQVLTIGLRSYIPTFRVFMPIWMSWL